MNGVLGKLGCVYIIKNTNSKLKMYENYILFLY